MKTLCKVYRSPRKEGMYLYLLHDADPQSIPEPLLKQFGTPELAMSLVLSPERKLARADVSMVIQAIESQGFYLQMPPRHDGKVAPLAAKNHKLEP